MNRKLKVNGYVWCDYVGGVHVDESDPHDDCPNGCHRVLYVNSKKTDPETMKEL